jgi:hypothetical protein
MIRIAVLGLVAILVGCSSVRATEPPSGVRQLRWLETADPITDAKRAVERRDFTLLAVNGYTWSIPGVPEADKFAYRDKYGMKPIEGTSDVIMGTEHARLVDVATKYAKSYNEYLLRHAR